MIKTDFWKFPKPEKVITTEEGRTYWFDNEPYESVTTVLGKKPKPELEAWKSREGLENATYITRNASDKGTTMHNLLEQYALTGNMPNTKFHDAKYAALEIKSIIDANVSLIHGVECRFYSKSLGIAGTTDLYCIYKNKLSIVDYKNSRRLKRREWIDDYFMQGCFYCIAAEELNYPQPEQIVIIIANENDPPSVFIESPDDWRTKTKRHLLQYKGQTK